MFDILFFGIFSHLFLYAVEIGQIAFVIAVIVFVIAVIVKIIKNKQTRKNPS
jgi:ABC-type protease/lipase transport system fused ATPase/permease subunit